MIIYDTTWAFLLQLTVDTNQRIPLHVYCYCVYHADDTLSMKDIQEGTGLNARSVKAGVGTLCDCGLLKIETGKHGQKSIVATNDITARIVVANDILYSYFNNRYIEKGKGDIRDDNSTYFTLEDVRADDDWKKAEPILAKYFKDFQFHPSHLVTKRQYFGKLVELLTDNAVDFDKYCHWYRVEKYPSKKFTYGLFLHAGVIAEFRNSTEDDEDSRYSNTATMNQSDSFKDRLKKTDEFLSEIMGDDDAS